MVTRSREVKARVVIKARIAPTRTARIPKAAIRAR